MFRSTTGFVLLSAVALGAIAAAPKRPEPRMKAAEIDYKPLTFAELPGWQADDHLAAFNTFLKSCERVMALARERAQSGGKPSPPAGLVQACTAANKLKAPVTRVAA